MAYTDKNLVITPNVGSAGEDPTITFSGADSTLGAQSLQARIYPTSNGTLSFEGSAGQLFSITNSLTGTIYSVNDVSGIPSIEVFDTGVIRLAQYSGRVLIGNISDNGVDTLQFDQNSSILFQNINVASQLTSSVSTGTAPFVVTSTTAVTNLNADLVDGIQGASLLRSDASDTYSGGILTVSNDAGIDVTNTGQINGLQIYQPTVNADALMSFHISGDYAVHFGLDGETNDLTVGGWSKGANKYRVWHAGNDGASSGLDADLLDGQHGSYYTTAGNLSGTIPSAVLGNSTLYVGTTAIALNRSSASLSLTGVNIDGSAGTFTSTSQNSRFNSIGVNTAASGTAGEIRATNNITAYFSSDRKFKENVKDVTDATEIVSAIGAKTFDWTDSYIQEHGGADGYFVTKNDFGVIAQDVQAVFPMAVRTREDGSLAVDYGKLAILAFAAIKELAERIKKLENK
jgi:hypothetical protein